MQILSRSEDETAQAARGLAARLTVPAILLLHGPLGAGKSVFARALIRGLTQNPDEEVPSPTFTLVQTYDAACGRLWHFDLYRLKDPEEIYELGWEDALRDIAIIEWPERLGHLRPRRHTAITFDPLPGQDEARRIVIEEMQT